MRLLTSDQARFLDQVSMEEFGISSIDLMKNAGKRIASKAKEMIVHRGWGAYSPSMHPTGIPTAQSLPTLH